MVSIGQMTGFPRARRCENQRRRAAVIDLEGAKSMGPPAIDDEGPWISRISQIGG